MGLFSKRKERETIQKPYEEKPLERQTEDAHVFGSVSFAQNQEKESGKVNIETEDDKSMKYEGEIFQDKVETAQVAEKAEERNSTQTIIMDTVEQNESAQPANGIVEEFSFVAEEIKEENGNEANVDNGEKINVQGAVDNADIVETASEQSEYKINANEVQHIELPEEDIEDDIPQNINKVTTNQNVSEQKKVADPVSTPPRRRFAYGEDDNGNQNVANARQMSQNDEAGAKSVDKWNFDFGGTKKQNATAKVEIDPAQVREIRTSVEGIKSNVRQEADAIRREIGVNISTERDQLNRIESGVLQGFASAKGQSNVEHMKTRSEIKSSIEDVKYAVGRTNDSIKQDVVNVERRVEMNARGVMDKIEENIRRDELNKGEVIGEIKRQTDTIMRKIDLNSNIVPQKVEVNVAPKENLNHKNIKMSVVSLTMAIFSALVLALFCVDVFKGLILGSKLSAVVFFDIGLVYIISFVSHVIAWSQKAKFFKKGIRTLGEYIKNQEEQHGIAKSGMLISFIVICITTLLLIIALIAFLVAMFMK